MSTVSLRRSAGDSREDAAVLDSRCPAASAGGDDPVVLALDLMGGLWKPLVAWQLFWGPRPLGELVRQTPGIAPWRVRRALAELERDELVSKLLRPSPSGPAEYALTPLGESAKPLLATLYEWGLGLRGRLARPEHSHLVPPLDGPWPRADSYRKEKS